MRNSARASRKRGVAGPGPSSNVIATDFLPDFARHTEGPNTEDDLPRTAQAAPAKAQPAIQQPAASSTADVFVITSMRIVSIRRSLLRSHDFFGDRVPA